MREHGLQGAHLRRGWKGGSTRQNPAHTSAPDLVERDFRASAPNRLWVADLTRILTGEGVLWLLRCVRMPSPTTCCCPTWRSRFSEGASGHPSSTGNRGELVCADLHQARGRGVVAQLPIDADAARLYILTVSPGVPEDGYCWCNGLLGRGNEKDRPIGNSRSSLVCEMNTSRRSDRSPSTNGELGGAVCAPSGARSAPPDQLVGLPTAS